MSTQRSVAWRTNQGQAREILMATPVLSPSLRHTSAFAADVRESLTKPGQRELPSKYLYDEVGSALFEAICVLPEYGLTRADARLLEKYAREIVGRLPSHNLSRILFQQPRVGPCQPVLRQHANRFK